MLSSLTDMPLEQVILLFLLGVLMGYGINQLAYALPFYLYSYWRRHCVQTLVWLENTPQKINTVPAQVTACAPQESTQAWQQWREHRYRDRQRLRYYTLFSSLMQGITMLLILSDTPLNHSALAWSILFSMGLLLALIDHYSLLLPDCLTQPLLWLGLLFHAQTGLVPLQEALWGALFGYLSLWGLYWLIKGLTGRQSLGGGDSKLLAALGAWLGWSCLPYLLTLAAGSGILYLLCRYRQLTMTTPLPFAPFLLLATWILFLSQYPTLLAH